MKKRNVREFLSFHFKSGPKIHNRRWSFDATFLFEELFLSTINLSEGQSELIQVSLSITWLLMSVMRLQDLLHRWRWRDSPSHRSWPADGGSCRWPHRFCLTVGDSFGKRSLYWPYQWSALPLHLLQNWQLEIRHL